MGMRTRAGTGLNPERSGEPRRGGVRHLALGAVLALSAAAPASAPPIAAGVESGRGSTVAEAEPVDRAAKERGKAGGCLPPVADARSIVVLGPFDPPAKRWLAGHRGVDLAAEAGFAVGAPCGGTVTFSGTVVDRGVVVVTHPDGLRSSLEPVTGTAAVGTAVRAGQQVGVLQDAPGHCAPTSCLHWGVRRGEVYLDPLALLGVAEPIVLLPG